MEPHQRSRGANRTGSGGQATSVCALAVEPQQAQRSDCFQHIASTAEPRNALALGPHPKLRCGGQAAYWGRSSRIRMCALADRPHQRRTRALKPHPNMCSCGQAAHRERFGGRAALVCPPCGQPLQLLRSSRWQHRALAVKPHPEKRSAVTAWRSHRRIGSRGRLIRIGAHTCGRAACNSCGQAARTPQLQSSGTLMSARAVDPHHITLIRQPNPAPTVAPQFSSGLAAFLWRSLAVSPHWVYASLPKRTEGFDTHLVAILFSNCLQGAQYPINRTCSQHLATREVNTHCDACIQYLATVGSYSRRSHLSSTSPR